MEVPFVNSESGKWTKNCTRFVTGCPKNVANFCKVTAAVAVNGLLSGGTASAPSRAAVKLGAASGQMTKQLTPTKDPFVPPPGPGKTPETVKLWASPRTAWPQRKAANRTLNACFKNPPKRRVRARGLQETMRFRHPCRPGPLTGRFSKHALRQHAGNCQAEMSDDEKKHCHQNDFNCRAGARLLGRLGVRAAEFDRQREF